MSLKIVQTEVKHRIAVAAGKGGVGKSSLSVLLAGAFKRLGERVGILDADLYGPSIRQMVKEQHMPKQENQKFIPAICSDVQVFSYAYFSNQATMRAPIANQVLKQFFQAIDWGDLETLFIDFPPGTGDIPLSLVQMVQLSGACIVTTPQQVAQLDVRKTIQMFQKVQVPILGIIENMSFFQTESCTPFGSGAGISLAEEFGVPFLGKVPLEPAISKAGDEGELLNLKIQAVEEAALRLKAQRSKLLEPIQAINLTEQKQLKIEWENGTISTLNAEQLQSICPCAQCKKTHAVDPHVLLLGYKKVGRYGMRFDFSSGCSSGIYPFSLLRDSHV